MTRLVSPIDAARHKRTRRAVWLCAAAVLLIGLAWADSAVDLLAYLVVVASALFPTALWLRKGRVGVPILPAIGALSILYYAIPIVRGREDLDAYSSIDIVRAATAVCLFLTIAVLAVHVVMRNVHSQPASRERLASESRLPVLVFLGLGLGNVYLAASAANLLWGLGPYYGLARSIALTSLVVACYFLGVGRGRGILRGSSWYLAIAGLGMAVLVSWSSLFLIGGLTFLAAAGVGYVSTRGRIPWVTVGVAVVLVTILHAGKEEMRDRYWEGGKGSNSQGGLLRLPGIALEWFETGLRTVGSPTIGRSAIDRASLLHILLRVQFLTPGYIDYLRGDTYALIPGMLVPRFLKENKTKSQAAMDLLNIRYGMLTVEGTEKTAVGWGLIAEGYANFGFLGVAGIGLLVGIVCGLFSRWSASGSAVSFSTLSAVAAMVGLINLEQDLASLMTSFLQSIAAVFVFIAVLRLFPKRRRTFAAHPAIAGLAQPRQLEPPTFSGLPLQ